MVRSERSEPAGADQSLGDLVAMAAKDVSQLIRYEIDLAKVELRARYEAGRHGRGRWGAFPPSSAAWCWCCSCFAFGYGLVAAGVWAWAAFLIVAGHLRTGGRGGGGDRLPQGAAAVGPAPDQGDGHQGHRDAAPRRAGRPEVSRRRRRPGSVPTASSPRSPPAGRGEMSAMADGRGFGGSDRRALDAPVGERQREPVPYRRSRRRAARAPAPRLSRILVDVAASAGLAAGGGLPGRRRGPAGVRRERQAAARVRPGHGRRRRGRADPARSARPTRWSSVTTGAA